MYELPENVLSCFIPFLAVMNREGMPEYLGYHW